MSDTPEQRAATPEQTAAIEKVIDAIHDICSDANEYTRDCPYGLPHGDKYSDAIRHVIFAAIKSAEVAATERATTWQPIETAPKDGTFILIAWAGAKNMYVSRWLQNEQRWTLPATTAALNPPTHWMLPAAPIVEGKP